MLPLDQFKKEIQNILDIDNQLFFYWKARIGLYALLKAMNIKEGDEVILPAFTCVVVANAILYLGATPIYVDVSSETYNMDIDLVKKAITSRTKVIICQNTYGLSTDLEVLQILASKYDIYTIEDCTHGFGGTYNGIPNGLSCDAAIFSTQWNKPFSTGVGGFTVTNNKILDRHISELRANLILPTFREKWNLKALYFTRRYLVNDHTYWPLVRFYRWLSHNTGVVGSSTIEEINSTVKPIDYNKGFSHTQAKEGLRNLKSLPENLARRKKNAGIYTEFLENHNKNYVDKKWFKNHSFLKYPLLVNNRKKFISLAQKNQVELGEWFISPLHPVTDDLAAWGLNVDKYPTAQYLSSHVVNLPTSSTNIDKVLIFLKNNITFLI